MLISLGTERGKMRKRHRRNRANLWSVYQWYGISDSGKPVINSYMEKHTVEKYI